MEKYEAICLNASQKLKETAVLWTAETTLFQKLKFLLENKDSYTSFRLNLGTDIQTYCYNRLLQYLDVTWVRF